MGEYYNWVNIDKKQYLCPNDFDHGNKISESSWEKDGILMALFELMETDWKGDQILWLGDEACPRNEYAGNNPVILKLYAMSSEDGYGSQILDYMLERFANPARRFRQTKPIVMDAYRIYREFGDTYEMEKYGLDLKNPEKGNFMDDGVWHRYVVNKMKREYVDQAEHLTEDAEGGFSGFPMLMSYGRMSAHGGPWIGDDLELTDVKPSSEYRLLSAGYVWHRFME